MNKKESKVKQIISYIGGDKLVLIFAIIAVFILFTVLNKNYMSIANITSILQAISLVGMVAIGHTYLIIAAQN